MSDANALAGRLSSDRFAGGNIKLDLEAARAAMGEQIAGPLGIEVDEAAYGVIEMVDENMANAGRVHAIERGQPLSGATMAAFGGGAPLHACRLANRLGIDAVIIPSGAGVGSAVGFLSAPVANEVVRTMHMRLDAFDAQAAHEIVERLRSQATQLVRTAAGDAPVAESRYASMRYVGQGHEIDVRLPGVISEASGGEEIRRAFEDEYRGLYTRTVPDVAIEIVTWRVRVTTLVEAGPTLDDPAAFPVEPRTSRRVFDNSEGKWLDYAIFDRSEIEPGAVFSGPALVIEDQTTTVVGADFDCFVNGARHLLLTRRSPSRS